MRAFIIRCAQFFRLISWYHIRRHPLRTILMLSVLTFGVGSTFAGTASLPIGQAAMSRGYDLAAGRAQIAVYASKIKDAVVTDEDLQTIRNTDGVGSAAPLILGGGLILGNAELLAFWGIDPAVERAVRDYTVVQGNFIAQPGQIMLTKDYAAEKGYTVGKQLALIGPGGLYNLTLVGTLEASGIASLNSGDLVVMGYADARALSGKSAITSIAVMPAPGQVIDTLIKRLQSVFPATAVVNKPQTFEASSLNVLSQTLVMLLSVLPISLGIVMITGTLAASIAQRHTEIGILRALGLTRGEIRNLFVVESAATGVVGSLLGLPLGRLMLRSIVPIWTASGGLSAPVDMTIPGWVAPLVFVFGVSLVVVSSIIPARRATRLDPVEEITRTRMDTGGVRVGTWQVVIGLAMLVGPGILRLFVDGTQDALIMPVAGIIGVSWGGALLFAPLMTSLSRRLPPLMVRLFGSSGFFAAQSLAQRPRHMIGTGIIAFWCVWFFALGNSMEHGDALFFENWLSNESAWSLTVAGPGSSANTPLTSIPSAIIQEITARPAVSTIVRQRMGTTRYGDQNYDIWAIDIAALRSHHGRLMLEYGDENTAYARLLDHQHPALFVGGFTAYLAGLRQIGKTITLNTVEGLVQFEVAGTLLLGGSPSASPNSYFVIDGPLYRQLWHDDKVDRMLLALKPGANVQEERRDLLRQYAANGILVADYATLRAITANPNGGAAATCSSVLPFMILAIANTLFIAVLDRQREIAILRALGVLRWQITASIILEMLIVIGIACLAAIPGAYYTMDVMLYSRLLAIPVSPDAVSISLVAAIVLGVGILASYVPARRASRLDVLDALHYQ